jgi:general L-amino acid transport system permease protein
LPSRVARGTPAAASGTVIDPRGNGPVRKRPSRGPGFVPQMLWARRRSRGILVQVVVLIALLLLAGWFAANVARNLSLLGVDTGYGFLAEPAGYDINQALIDYDSTSPHWRAALVGLLNTLLVSLCGIVLATVVGFAAGVMRLSRNWPVRTLMSAYVEFARNVPVLLHILLWYGLIIHTLPHPRQAAEPFDDIFLTNRGIYLPEPVPEPGLSLVLVALALGILATLLYREYARRFRLRTGRPLPVLWPGLLLVVAVPSVVFLVAGRPLSLSPPELGGFNFEGGVVLRPEFTALWLGLSLYTAAFIAENVRGGIQSIDRGQVDAAHALGLRGMAVMRLVILPQALRVIVPPLISQYLNLIKNSSLAIAIGYMDLVATIGGISLNQTGRALECMSIVLAVYLLISLSVSTLMNWYNRRTALVER